MLQGTDPLQICQEVVARGLHPEGVDVDTGQQVLPLVLDDRHHLLTWIRLYSRCLTASSLFLAGAVDRCAWEIEAALIAAQDAPCFLDEIYLAELRALLRSAQQEVLAGETGIEHYGPYVSLTMAENLCVTRMIRREVHADRRRYPRT
ncbi:hypothetical protein [Rhizocola hellebori]|uniref:hypothetical protein n=1 Tax=Rhizocola hellebori TaxID=1392758 RepID=UPI001940F4D9|nr:hypothetical protein [Rhizocola hellebori]